MDNPALIDRGSAWLAEAANAEQAKTHDVPLVSWVDQIAIADDGLSARLHFLVVDHLVGIGLVVAGWFADPRPEVATISFDSGVSGQIDLRTGAALLTDRHHVEGFRVPKGRAVRFGFVLLMPDPPTDTADGLRVRVQLAAGEISEHVVPRVGDVLDLSDILAAAPIDHALGAVGRLLGAWRSTSSRSYRLPERLEALAVRVHERVDPRWDYGVPRECAHASCHVDTAIRVGTKGVLVAGWLIPDYRDHVKDVALVSLFGRRVVLGTGLPTKSRPDVVATEGRGHAAIDCGFATFAAIEGLDRVDALWFLEVIMASGAIKRAPFVCPAEPTPLQGIEAAVVIAEAKDKDLADLFERAVSPAVEWFWAQTRCPAMASAETVYGEKPLGARVSVIVPVYGRLDFVRHQIAGFSNDPEFRAEAGIVDLIYVLDDPAKADEFGRLCRFLHEVYGLPFRVLVQGRNLGYSAANNAGASIARGRVLLLLNSDVFPRKPGWVGRLVSSYDSLDSCGVLGCRLLFEDGSIQHAGMSFRQSEMLPGCWENDHPGRGLSVAFDAHAGAEAVPAVTGACLMIGRALFARLGGMSEDYVIGDFEDSDLCLRAREAGLRIYYTPEVELYHLERQSMQLIGRQDVWWRQSLTLYNMWKHSRRWGQFIPQILETPEAAVTTRFEPMPIQITPEIDALGGGDEMSEPGRGRRKHRSAGTRKGPKGTARG